MTANGRVIRELDHVARNGRLHIIDDVMSSVYDRWDTLAKVDLARWSWIKQHLLVMFRVFILIIIDQSCALLVNSLQFLNPVFYNKIS